MRQNHGKSKNSPPKKSLISRITLVCGVLAIFFFYQSPGKAAIDPVTGAALGQAVASVAQNLSGKAFELVEWTSDQFRRLKKKRNAAIREIRIEVLANNRGTIHWYYYCGYRHLGKKGIRERVKSRVYANNKLIYEKAAESHQHKGWEQAKLTALVPLEDIEHAIAGGASKVTVALKVVSTCHTTKKRKAHPKHPKYEVLVPVSLSDAYQAAIDQKAKKPDSEESRKRRAERLKRAVAFTPDEISELQRKLSALKSRQERAERRNETSRLPATPEQIAEIQRVLEAIRFRQERAERRADRKRLPPTPAEIAQIQQALEILDNLEVVDQSTAATALIVDALKNSRSKTDDKAQDREIQDSLKQTLGD